MNNQDTIFKRWSISLEVYQEEETSTFTHWGKHYSLNKLFRLVEHIKPTDMSIDLLCPMNKTEYTEEDDLLRVEQAQTQFPLLVTTDRWSNGKYWVLDGNHRLTKLVQSGAKKVKVIIVPSSILQQAMITQEEFDRLKAMN